MQGGLSYLPEISQLVCGSAELQAQVFLALCAGSESDPTQLWLHISFMCYSPQWVCTPA